MKKIKYFVSSLLICFSFGCGPNKSQAEYNLNVLAKHLTNKDFQCVRNDIDDPFICLASNESDIIICDINSCYIKQCANPT